jgi:predicted nicotinamide N-methyase
VLDVGAGGGVSSLAAARAGAARVVANDIDERALATAALAARRQGLELETSPVDLTLTPELVEGFDVVVGGDLAYEQQQAPRQLSLLRRAAGHGAWVLAADAGRSYFDPAGMRLLAEYRLAVPRDLEGVDERVARVYEVLPSP